MSAWNTGGSGGEPPESQKFCTVHCTGYIRSWPASHFGAEGEGEADEQDSSHFSYLMAMGRVHSHSSPQLNGEVCVKPSSSHVMLWMENSPLSIKEDGRKSHPVVPGTSDFKIYAGSIGAQIAKELLDYNRMNTSPSCCSVSPFSRPRDKCPQTHNPISNNVPDGGAADMEMPGKCGSEDDQGAAFSEEGNSQLDSDCVVGPGLSNLSGDEAAMAVFMSLLETDTNPGEAADIQEMHWSL